MNKIKSLTKTFMAVIFAFAMLFSGIAFALINNVQSVYATGDGWTWGSNQTSSTLPNATIGSEYSVSISSNDSDVSSITVDISPSGSGLTGSQSGYFNYDVGIVGTPTTAGTYTVTCTAYQASELVSTKVYSLTIEAPADSGTWTWSSGALNDQTSNALPNATVGEDYQVVFTCSSATSMWTATSYITPSLSFNPYKGTMVYPVGNQTAIQGQPTTAGTYTVICVCEEPLALEPGSAYCKTYTLTVDDGWKWSSGSQTNQKSNTLPDAVVGDAYSITITSPYDAGDCISGTTISYSSTGSIQNPTFVEPDPPYYSNNNIAGISSGVPTYAGTYTAHVTNDCGSKDYSLTVKAKVIYDANGASGTVTDSNSPYIQGETATVLDGTGLTKDGYIFNGWNTKSDGKGTSYAAGSSLSIGTTNTTLYADWVKVINAQPNYFNGYSVVVNTALTGTITYQWYKQASGETAVAISGATLNSFPASMTLEDVNYYCEVSIDGTKVATSNSVLPIKVVFNGNTADSGTAPSTQYILYKDGYEAVILPSNPFTKAGFKFVGWSSNSSATSGSTSKYYYVGYGDDTDGTMTLYAIWESLAYDKEITLTMTTLEYGLKVSNISVSVNDSNLKVVDFELWYDGAIIDTVTKPGVYTFYVIIEGKSNTYYFVNTHDSSSSVIFPDYYSNNVKVSGNTVIISLGAPFPLSWGVTSCDLTSEINFFGDMSNKAYENVVLGNRFSFNLTGYSVTYDDNVTDEEITMPEDTNTYLEDAPVTISTTIPTRNGYNFIGWNTNKNATTKLDSYTMGDSDVTLYAIWEAVTYNITYKLDDGINGSNPITYNIKTETITLENPTKVGYIFAGWYGNYEFNGSAITQIEKGSYGDIILYAKWTPITHTCNSITFYPLTTSFSGGILAEGNYYLFEDIALSSGSIIIQSGKTINLCLNGKVLDLDGNNIQNNGTLNIYDCGSTENIISSKTYEGGVITGGNGCDITIGSDTTEVNVGGAIYNKGTLNIYGGNFVKNSAKLGGAIFTDKAATITLKKCNITDNTATENGGGIYVCNQNTAIADANCFAKGTKITLADGTTKNIENIVEGDVVKTFDHETGLISSETVCLAYKGETKEYYFTLNFTNNKSLEIVGCHDLFEQSSLKYTTINSANASEYIGKYFYNACLNTWEQLLSVTYSTEKTEYYSIYTAHHLNCIANDMLSVADDVDYLLNIFNFDETNFKIDQEQKQEDIDNYGLFSYDEASAYMTEEYFDNFNTKYYNIAIGKGLKTHKEMFQLLLDTNEYLNQKAQNASPKNAPFMALGSGNISIFAITIGSNAKIENNIVSNSTVDNQTNNIYLTENCYIEIENEATGFNAGITLENTTGTFVSNAVNITDLQNFSSDNANYFTKSREVEGTPTTYNYNIEAKYTVTYDKNTATSGSVPTDSKTYFSGEAVSLLGNTGILEKPTYIFLGWNTDKNATTKLDSYTMGDSNVTLYAIWQDTYYSKNIAVTISNITKYTEADDIAITTDRDDELNLDSIHILQPVDPDGLEYTSSISKPGEYMILAVYTAKDGKAFRKGTYGYVQAYPSCTNCFCGGTIVASSFDFTKMYDDEEFATAGATDYDNTKLLIFLAVLVEGGNTISFNANTTETVTGLPEDTIYLKETPVSLPTLSGRAGYNFLGWNTDKNATTALTFENDKYIMGDSDVTLYAIWQEKTAVSITETAQTYTYNTAYHAFELKGTHKDIGLFTIEYYYSSGWFTTNPISAGSYNVRITRAEDATYKAYSKEITNGLVINKVATTMEITSILSYETTYEGIIFQLSRFGYANVYDINGNGVGCESTRSSDKEILNVGTYKVTYTYDGDDNHLGCECSFNYVIKPAVVNNSDYNLEQTAFTFTGNPHTITITNFEDIQDFATITQESVVTATNYCSDGYKVYIELDENHIWQNDSSRVKELTWFINKLCLSPEIDTEDEIVTAIYGQEIVLPSYSIEEGWENEVSFDGYSYFSTLYLEDEECYYFYEEITQEEMKDVGVYIVLYNLTTTNPNISVDFSGLYVYIEKAKVSEPTVVGTYKNTGNAQTVALNGFESYMTTSDSLTQTDAGVYTINFALDNNHEWADGSDGVITWEIKSSSISPKQEEGEEAPEKQEVIVETEDGFASDISVVVEVTIETEIEQKELAVDYYNLEDEMKLADNEKVGIVFEVKLIQTIDGVSREIQPSDIKEGTKIKVKMLIPESVDISKVTRILHVHSAGDIEEIAFDASKVDQNRYYEIEIDRLSEFAFIYQTSDSIVLICSIVGGVVLLLLIIALILLFLLKRKITFIVSGEEVDQLKLRPYAKITYTKELEKYKWYVDGQFKEEFTSQKMGLTSIKLYGMKNVKSK